MIKAECDRCGDSATVADVVSLVGRYVKLPDDWRRVPVPLGSKEVGTSQMRLDLCELCVNAVRQVMLNPGADGLWHSGHGQAVGSYVAPESIVPPAGFVLRAMQPKPYGDRYTLASRPSSDGTFETLTCAECPDWKAITRTTARSSPATVDKWIRETVEEHERQVTHAIGFHEPTPQRKGAQTAEGQQVVCECGKQLLWINRLLSWVHFDALPLSQQGTPAFYGKTPDVIRHPKTETAKSEFDIDPNPVCNTCGATVLWDRIGSEWIHEEGVSDHNAIPIPVDEYERGERP